MIYYMECKGHVNLRLTTIAKELVRYKLDLVGVQDVKWEKGGPVRAEDYFILCKRKRQSPIGNRIFCSYTTD